VAESYSFPSAVYLPLQLIGRHALYIKKTSMHSTRNSSHPRATQLRYVLALRTTNTAYLTQRSLSGLGDKIWNSRPQRAITHIIARCVLRAH